MNDSTLAIWGLVMSLIGLACVLFFKGPKETSTEISRRVDTLEDRHHDLDRDFFGFQERILAEMRSLTDAINRLASVVGERGVSSTTGEHRVVKRRGDG